MNACMSGSVTSSLYMYVPIYVGRIIRMTSLRLVRTKAHNIAYYYIGMLKNETDIQIMLSV